MCIKVGCYAGNCVGAGRDCFSGWAYGACRLSWVDVVFVALSLILNLITPSAGERAIWAPVALMVSSLIVARGASTPKVNKV